MDSTFPATPTVADASEAQLVELLAATLPSGPSSDVVLGIGDDAAVLAPSPLSTVATVDAAVEGEDFLSRWPCGYATTGWDVGFKSCAQNLSDVNAMGARATTALLVLSLPASTPLEWVRGYARGFSAAASALGAQRLRVTGGDLSGSRTLMVSVSMNGELAGEPLLRSGAGVGDALIVVGEPLGRADVSLGLLASGRPEDRIEAWDERAHAVSRGLFEPRPPLAAGPALVGVASAAMDISDGLVRDGARLARASGVGLALDRSALEAELEALRAWAGRHATRGLDHVLYGGEDHLVLATLPPGLPLPAGARRIGSVVEGAGVGLGGEALDERRGFDHFA
ncbi:MAG: thiamine-phosphate kinase [Arthrobacter sp.]|nr:thiamine-phosphate kinase [Arthrobacter sp.]